MQATAEPMKKSRPFPWHCYNCRQQEVVRTTIPYSTEVNHDGSLHTVTVPQLAVPRCRACGELVFDNIADEQITTALRSQLHLLTPDDLRNGRDRIGFTRSALANRLGVSEKTIADWEDGLTIQSRAMDNFLRVYFALPEVRAVLTGNEQNPTLGVLVG
jgi:putative zinc finger/helix-turn-helix YgiT family protein